MGTFTDRGSMRSPENALADWLDRFVSDPDYPVLTAALGVVRDGAVIFCDAAGFRQLGGEPATCDTKYRIASISKLITAVGVWQLIEQGLIDPDADASAYLGFPLRNPNFPNVPITVRMIMSHTSSVREGGSKPGTYNIPYGHALSEFFTKGKPCHNPDCWAAGGEAPGEYFTYCNMNYCLLGQIVETVSGERFDKYMVDHVFAPMGLSCSYNVSEMPREVQEQVGTLYRKLNKAGEPDPANGVWTPQQDDFTGGYPDTDYSGYVIGTNGSLFGPMGSLRISLRELCEIMLMFCSGGSYHGVRILKPETVERMFTPVWTYDPVLQNGNTYGSLNHCYGMGPHILTNREKGDRPFPGQDLPFAGHSAEAYGLIGGMYFDRQKGNGLVYFMAGIGNDMSRCPGRYSAFYALEEALFTAGAEFAQFCY